MKRKIFCMLAFIGLCVVCSACGKPAEWETETVSVETQGTAAEIPEKYKDYDGYGYCEQDGHLKYYIEIGEKLRLHCFFQSGSPEYEEKIYTLHLPEKENTDGELEIRQITDEN